MTMYTIAELMTDAKRRIRRQTYKPRSEKMDSDPVTATATSEPASFERFRCRRHRDDDEYVITVRDNLTGEERTWGDFTGVEPAIERWEKSQIEKRPA